MWLFTVCMYSYFCVWPFWLPISNFALPRVAAVKKSIRLKEEALAKEKEQVKTKSGQTSAEKLRKILKDEKR